ncbi:hypothetical protein CPB84DRAFT_1853946 [Gymnopilus junonius]|uniref:Uncharacterized protein n=1 Tax=Gymnopilus junonius TaxID=109634 RepID=A0A9P5N959_GYMJU|nr:hypothetical protein CPB84DRAFT_1853946 [Gymnopilus junonius]
MVCLYLKPQPSMGDQQNQCKQKSSAQPLATRKSTRLSSASSEYPANNIVHDTIQRGAESESGTMPQHQEESLTAEERQEMEDDPDADASSEKSAPVQEVMEIADLDLDLDNDSVPAAILLLKGQRVLKVIGPKSSTKASALKKAKRASTEEDSKEEENVPPKPKIAFILPCADSEAMQHIPINWNSSFEEVVEWVHEALQCTNIVKKPILLYKLPSAKQKQNPFSLSMVEDWEGCRDVIMDEVAKKKRNDMGTIQVSIELGPENYLESLPSKNKKKKPAPLLDLDNEDDYGLEDVQNDEEGLSLLELKDKQLEIQQCHLSHCQCCGTDVFCKIDKTGTHISLSMPQRRAWANALALQTHGVTLHTPPTGRLFTEFHSNQKGSHSQAPSAGPGPSGGPFGQPPGWNNMYSMPPIPYYFHQPFPPQGMGAGPPQPSLPDQNKSTSLQSDSGPGEEQYPGIYGFFSELVNANHDRPDLQDVADRFIQQDVKMLREVAALDETFLCEHFSLTIGNAKFILLEVKREIQCIKCSHGKQ